MNLILLLSFNFKPTFRYPVVLEFILYCSASLKLASNTLDLKALKTPLKWLKDLEWEAFTKIDKSLPKISNFLAAEKEPLKFIGVESVSVSQPWKVIKFWSAYSFLWKPSDTSLFIIVVLKSSERFKTLVFVPLDKEIEYPFLEYSLEFTSTLPEPWSA